MSSTDKKYHVFVYGSLKRGFGNNLLLSTSEYVCSCETREPIYTMYNLGSFPGIIKRGYTKIQGEVYSVSEEVLARLDILESVPNLYTRELVPISNLEVGTAFIYIYNNGGDSGVSAPIVPNGEWLIST